MNIIEEIDYMLGTDEGGLKTLSDEEALYNRILHWFDTPIGSIADNPSWGHPLLMLQHEPGGPDFEVMAEMLIMEKLPKDIKNLIVIGFRVEFLEIDLFNVVIEHQLDVFNETISL